MKKYIDIALAYAIAAMAGGVFYREFTKFSHFNGRTTLAFVHTHLFLLGMVMFLVIALFAGRYRLDRLRLWKPFLGLYNGGVILTVVMLVLRGVLQVKAFPLHPGMDAAVSGIAGIGHILTGVGLILLFLCLRKCAVEKELEKAA